MRDETVATVRWGGKKKDCQEMRVESQGRENSRDTMGKMAYCPVRLADGIWVRE